MEENQNNQAQESPMFQQNQSSGVSFPTVNETKKSGGPKMFLIVGILILVAILGFVIYKSATSKSEDTPEPTPFDNLTDTTQNVSTPVATATPTPVGTPKASIDKSKIKIEVQNGTGTPGDAAYLQTQLKSLGYTDVKAGNATEQNATTTTVTFSSKLDASIVSEITQKLNALYATVSTKTSSTQTFDVVVITGTKKGATAKPSSSPTATSTGTPRATATPTGSPKATSTP